MNTYYPDSKIPIGIWEGEAILQYGEKSLTIEIAGEAPFGDFVYKAKLNEKKLKQWIYGRAMIFFGERYALFESVEENSFGPIDSIIIDLKEEKWISLGGWYNKAKKLDDEVVLVSGQGEELVIEDLALLTWASI